MLSKIRSMLGREKATRPDLACPACGADNKEYAKRCQACGKSLYNYWRREKAQYTRDYDDGFNSGIFIMIRQDSCPACRELQGIQYKPWELPRLPVNECAHPGGCRCEYTPLTKISLGLPGLGFRARKKDWEERQAEKRVREEREADANAE